MAYDHVSVSGDVANAACDETVSRSLGSRTRAVGMTLSAPDCRFQHLNKLPVLAAAADVVDSDGQSVVLAGSNIPTTVQQIIISDSIRLSI